MRIFNTEFKAICVKTGFLVTFQGENVKAKSWKQAQRWCDENKGHLKVVGELVSVVENRKEVNFSNNINDKPR